MLCLLDRGLFDLGSVHDKIRSPFGGVGGGRCRDEGVARRFPEYDARDSGAEMEGWREGKEWLVINNLRDC